MNSIVIYFKRNSLGIMFDVRRSISKALFKLIVEYMLSFMIIH